MDRQTVVAVIPARRGSKSIQGKNHRVIAGRPLVSWVLEAALDAACVGRVVIATDDPLVREIGEAQGVELHERSPATATDAAPTEMVLEEVVDSIDIDHYVLLQPTSPLTSAADIDAAVDLYFSGGYDSVVSVVPQSRFLWQIDEDGCGVPVNYEPHHRPRRQDAEPILIENGAIYVSSAEILRREKSRLAGHIGILKMPASTYHELDEPEDWDIIERLLLERGRSQPSWDKVKLVISDVDGVLTDNGMYWSSEGGEAKKFSARDGKGFELLHTYGIKTALITSEASDLVARRGEKLRCCRVVLGCHDKVAAADALRSELGLTWAQVAFIGDDVHDIPLLELAGASFAPRDAVTPVRQVVEHVLLSTGGSGCFRELCDLLIPADR